MTILLLFAYAIYAILQAALASRFFIKDEEPDGFIIIMMAIFAPILTVWVVFHYLGVGILWIATPKKFRKEN